MTDEQNRIDVLDARIKDLDLRLTDKDALLVVMLAAIVKLLAAKVVTPTEAREWLGMLALEEQNRAGVHFDA